MQPRNTDVQNVWMLSKTQFRWYIDVDSALRNNFHKLEIVVHLERVRVSSLDVVIRAQLEMTCIH